MVTRDGVHVAGPAGPIDQCCARCGVVLIDGVPAVEGRMFEFTADGGAQRTRPMFFREGLNVDVRGGGMWLTDDPPTCTPE